MKVITCQDQRVARTAFCVLGTAIVVVEFVALVGAERWKNKNLDFVKHVTVKHGFTFIVSKL